MENNFWKFFFDEYFLDLTFDNGQKIAGKASATLVDAASGLSSTPVNPMTVTATVVDTATQPTFPELGTKLFSGTITPYIPPHYAHYGATVGRMEQASAYVLDSQQYQTRKPRTRHIYFFSQTMSLSWPMGRNKTAMVRISPMITNLIGRHVGIEADRDARNSHYNTAVTDHPKG